MKYITTFISFITLTICTFAQNGINGTLKTNEGEIPKNVIVSLDNTNIKTKIDIKGYFEFKNLPDGSYVIHINDTRWNEYKSDTIALSNNKEYKLEILLEPKVYNFRELTVYGASKKYEKITQSPASVTVQYPSDIEIASRRNHIATALEGEAGISILRNGNSDFIVNTRGFNNGLNRRLLVLQDGRDVSMPLLGAMEWNSFPMPLDEFSRIELVRGPSASLYGANAFNGVLNLKSYSPQEVLGTRFSVLGGDYNTLRGDIRHAGEFGRFSYKITLGHSQSLNLSQRRDSLKYLEYPGLAIEKRPIRNDERNTFANYGTIRFDYDLLNDRTITAEAGYSRSGNEAYVFGLGRTFVKDVEKPYFRMEYNSSDINVHAHYMKRSVPDTMWLLVPGAPLLDNSDDMLLDFQHNINVANNFNVVWGLAEQIQNIRTYGTSIPNDVNANYTGIYSQLDYSFSKMIKAVASARVDFASIHKTQFSPRVALVISPWEDHTFRLSAGRSFQRPNYSELYRSTPDAPAFVKDGSRPINFANVQKRIADSLSTLYGSPVNINLNLNSARALALGNDKLNVEQNIGFELGYKGVITKSLYVTVDAYYSILNDFITNFLPGANPNIQAWEPQLADSLSQYTNLVKSLVMNELNPRDKQRLSMYNGLPTFVVSNTNVGKVEQYGVDLSVNYYFTDELLLGANYSYYDSKVVKSTLLQPLLSNTSPHTFNISLSYIKQKNWDICATFHYAEKFDWLAGTYQGVVPVFITLNLNGGVYIYKGLQLGFNIYNLLNRQQYQIFGGTYLPRTFTVKTVYEF